MSARIWLARIGLIGCTQFFGTRGVVDRSLASLAGMLLSAGTLFAQPVTAPVVAEQTPTAAPVATEQATPAERSERFYNVEMFGGKAGWMRELVTTKPDGSIITESTMSFNIKRGELAIKIRMETNFVEKADGTPVSMRSLQRLGALPIETEYTFRENDVLVITSQNNAKTEETKPLPEGEWLTPGASDRFIKARRAAGAKVITLRLIDPSNGLKPVTIERTEHEMERMSVLGRDIDVTRTTLKVTTGGMNVDSTEYVDDAGVMVKSSTTISSIDVTMLLTSAEEAMQAGAAPEIMVSTFITPDKAIARAREATQATFLVVAKQGELDLLPTTGSQSVERVDAQTLRVKVNTAFPNSAAASAKANTAMKGDIKPNAGTPAEAVALLKATPMANSADAKIKALTAQVLDKAIADANAPDGNPEGKLEDKLEVSKPVEITTMQKGEAIRRFVHSYINSKTLGVGFASATEVAKTRTGDCTEHAVLLVAMLRAAEIPSRAASGLIYADQFAGSEHIFGYHMWAQALMEVNGLPTWVDLDATLPSGTPFDATHITISTTDLSGEDSTTALMPVAMLMGRIDVRVEEVSHK